MHYFKRNIGDYHKKAGRLSMLQHGAYTLLMDACYDRERFPTLEEAIDWCWASTDEEITAVKFVLNKFFDLVDGRYTQQRIQDEIDGFHGKSETNKRIAKEREEKRRARTRNVLEASPVEHEAPPNQEPLTTNQEPQPERAPRKRSAVPLVDRPEDVPEQTWADWLQLRKAKKAPVTETVLRDARREAEKAGLSIARFFEIWCARGSQGLQADWIKTSDRGTGPKRVYHDISAMDYTRGVSDDGRF